MACTKSLSMTEVAGDTFTPLTSAVYCPGSGTILGTSGNYVAEFNASTGAFIRAVRTIAPMYGPMWIALLGGAPYVSCWNDRSNQYTVFSGAGSRMDIYPINTSTLESGTGIGVYQTNWAGALTSYLGPRNLLSIGTKALFLLPLEDYTNLAYVTVGSPLTTSSQKASWGWWTEQICTDGTYIYYGDPYSEEIAYRNSNASLTYTGYASCAGYHPIACDYISGLFSNNGIYAVCGDNNLLYADNFITHHSTRVDLDAATGQSGIKAMRLRFDSVSNFIYIPVQNKDAVILYDPTGVIPTTWKSGFASPVDCVFTPSGKKFAVQTSEVGLKEIEP